VYATRTGTGVPANAKTTCGELRYGFFMDEPKFPRAVAVSYADAMYIDRESGIGNRESARVYKVTHTR
jgi:hypothetical protein